MRSSAMTPGLAPLKQRLIKRGNPFFLVRAGRHAFKAKTARSGNRKSFSKYGSRSRSSVTALSSGPMIAGGTSLTNDGLLLVLAPGLALHFGGRQRVAQHHPACHHIRQQDVFTHVYLLTSAR
jgi:hypothetical protein